MNPLLIRRRGMTQAQGGVSYDSKIEFLQLTSNGPTIDLLYQGNGQAIIDAICVTASSGTQVLFCTRTDVIGGSWFGKVNTNYWGLGASIRSDIASTTRALSEITANSNGMTAIVNVGAPFSRDFEGIYNHYGWHLFANSNGNYPFYGKVYSFKGYDSNNVLFRDMFPVRVGTVGYMYDRVSGQLFGNAGTGAFILGPDIQ